MANTGRTGHSTAINDVRYQAMVRLLAQIIVKSANERGISERELSEKSGISRSSLRAMQGDGHTESHKGHMRVAELIALSEAILMTPDRLLSMAYNMIE
jgi:lambda repressor-like predicted transcriptional regulator